MSALLSRTSMGGLPAEEQAKRAIRHVLEVIHTHPEIGWYMGLGTQSFGLLTEAAATLFGEPVEQVRTHFRPQEPRNPYAQEGGDE